MGNCDYEVQRRTGTLFGSGPFVFHSGIESGDIFFCSIKILVKLNLNVVSNLFDREKSQDIITFKLVIAHFYSEFM